MTKTRQIIVLMSPTATRPSCVGYLGLANSPLDPERCYSCLFSAQGQTHPRGLPRKWRTEHGWSTNACPGTARPAGFPTLSLSEASVSRQHRVLGLLERLGRKSDLIPGLLKASVSAVGIGRHPLPHRCKRVSVSFMCQLIGAKVLSCHSDIIWVWLRVFRCQRRLTQYL